MEDYRAVGKRNMCWIQWEFSEISVANKETQRLALATKETNKGAGARGEETNGGEGGDEKRVTLQTRIASRESLAEGMRRNRLKRTAIRNGNKVGILLIT